MTARLTGWEVDIDAEHIVTKGIDEKIADAVEALATIPGVTREQASALVHNGVHTGWKICFRRKPRIFRTSRKSVKARRRFWKPHAPKRDAVHYLSGKRPVNS
ncbi:MAG: hypothetical protein WDN00_18600 [Limisphaerales bacterium]